ncbi:hypothetical protein Nepgr_015706 [Nepenthes gracilis]|uniref:Uncharacterized protein n=1 Tax=Nepenthes gracilis TaxID=150966 RepID=A0AAD3SLF3_NEPGR|nr:hypothetical protein Nepgr_015706 [Nepenthes gracilis]
MPNANAEIFISMQKSQSQPTSRSRSENFKPNQEEVASDFSIAPPRLFQAVEESINSQGQTEIVAIVRAQNSHLLLHPHHLAANYNGKTMEHISSILNTIVPNPNFKMGVPKVKLCNIINEGMSSKDELPCIKEKDLKIGFSEL